MAKQYFYNFTNNHWASYDAAGLYVCDRLVTEKEWLQHLLEFEDIKNKAWIPFMGGDNDDRRGWYGWCEKNRPCVSFAALHGMVKVGVFDLYNDEG